MKFIINTANIKSGGGLQVAASLILEWQEHCAEHEFHLILSPQFAAHITDIPLKNNFYSYLLHQNPNSNISAWIRAKKLIKQIENKVGIDATFSIFGPSLLTSNSPQLLGFANGYYLFDDSQFILQRLQSSFIHYCRYKIRQKLIFQRLKKEGDHFWVETKKAQEKLSKALTLPQKKISVVGNSATNQLTQKPRPTGFKTPYRLIYLSAYYEHKNFEVIPRVISLLEKKNIEVEFLLSIEDVIFRKVFGESNRRYVYNLGQVKSSDIQQTYLCADAVFMPSLLETFSANYPEAMTVGLPILCSDLDFSREICGQAALYFDPYDAEDIAAKIEQLINNKNLQISLIEAGFERLKNLESPKGRAQKLLQLLVQLGSKKQELCVAL